mmetsp:Transcript_38185/g.106383  ORF Transcript_38185/g.106383 Transcript_38185/m.106383 type:complete len:344 (-) Transcript_38185:716-1747(-)
MILQQEAEVVVPSDAEHLPQALVDEQVLAPIAVSPALLLEVLDAARRARGPGRHGVPREDLQRTVHAKLAIVQVDARLLFWVDRQDILEPVREKHGVRVDLHSPIMLLEAALADDLRPDSDENVQVECRSKLAALPALEVAVNDECDQASVHLDDPVAVHSSLVTPKQAHFLLVLHRQKFLLVAVRQHKRKAIKRASWVVRQGLLVASGSKFPTLHGALGVACLHDHLSTVDIGLCCFNAGPAPVLDNAHVTVVHPLLTPVAGIAREHLERDERPGPVHGVQAHATPVLHLAGLLHVDPLLGDLAIGASLHGNLGPRHRRCGFEAEAVADLDVALDERGALLH